MYTTWPFPGHRHTETQSSFPEDFTNRVGQLEGLISTTLSNLEPSALAGLDTLLQILQNSGSVSSHTTTPVDFDLTSGSATDHTVQIAAAALDQLLQQGQAVALSNETGASMTPFGPIIDMLHHVCNCCTVLRILTSRFWPLQIRGNSSASGASYLSDLHQHFPNRKITNFLVKYFFEESSVHWQYLMIHRPYFNNCYTTFSNGPIPPSLEFTALLAIVCATALQFLPESDEDVSFP